MLHNFYLLLFGDQNTSALHAAWWQAIAAVFSLGAVILISTRQNKLSREQNEFLIEQQKKENERQERMSIAIRTIVADKLEMISSQIKEGVRTGNWRFVSEISTFELPVSIKDLASSLEAELIQQIHFHLDIAHTIQRSVTISDVIISNDQLNEFWLMSQKMQNLANVIRPKV